MHSVSIILNTGSFRFMFKDKEKAGTFQTFHSDHPVQDLIIEDDFGQHGTFRAPAIQGIIVEDMELSRLAAVELMLHNARSQAQAQVQALTDPKLKMPKPGPQVLTPFNGRM